MDKMDNVEHPLSAVQQRTILAVVRELERLDHEVQETQAALNELASWYAADLGLPPGQFNLVRKDDGAVVLVVRPAAAAEENA